MGCRKCRFCDSPVAWQGSAVKMKTADFWTQTVHRYGKDKKPTKTDKYNQKTFYTEKMIKENGLQESNKSL